MPFGRPGRARALPRVPHRAAELGAGVLGSLGPADLHSLSLDVAPRRSRLLSPLPAKVIIQQTIVNLKAPGIPHAALEPRWLVALNQDRRREFAIMQPSDRTDITLIPHSPWVWHVYLQGEHVVTVKGATVDGFTARDIDHRSIGHGFMSAEAAIQAWADPHEDNPG